NRAAKSEIRTSVRRLLDTIRTGPIESAEDVFKMVAKKTDRAAAANVIHPNRAARIKSRLSARLLAAKRGSPTASSSSEPGASSQPRASRKGQSATR
ncbi:MAG: 30S ribosomal protein S20, partial [Planctomycetaceae bacterium]